MGDPGASQGQHRAQVLVDQVVTDLPGREVTQWHALGQARHQCRVVARAATTCRDHLGCVNARMTGEEREVCLVFDLLEPVEDQSGTRIAIDAEAPHLAQPLRVGRVTPVDGKFEGVPVRVGTGKAGHAPLPAIHRHQITDVDLQVAHGIGDFACGRQTVRRAEGQVAGGRGAPTRDEGSHDAEGQAVPANECAQGGQPDGEQDESVHRPAQIREPGTCHGRRDCELDHGEMGIEAGESGHGLTAGVRTQQRVEQEADEDRGDRRQRHVPYGSEPRDQQSEQDQRHRDADRAHEPQSGDQPPDAGRRRSEELCQVDLHRGIGVRQRDKDDEEGGRHAHPDRVGSPSPRRPATAWPKDE